MSVVTQPLARRRLQCKTSPRTVGNAFLTLAAFLFELGLPGAVNVSVDYEEAYGRWLRNSGGKVRKGNGTGTKNGFLKGSR